MLTIFTTTTMKMLLTLSLILLPPSFGFFVHPGSKSSSSFYMAGQGFGNEKQQQPPSKTYTSQETTPIRDMIDSESAMKEFFNAREDWMDLFRSIADRECQAMDFLQSTMDQIDFHEDTSPWRRLNDKPTDENHRQLLGGFLDSMQQSLIDIPVTEGSEEDENDLHFLEEGRRLLAISRFHVVVKEEEDTSIERHDALFATCWSEIKHLSHQDESHTGSLILVPNSSLTDLRRFTDMNLQRPLQWLGIDDFEIAAMERETPAIRLLYKLNDMPTDTYEE